MKIHGIYTAIITPFTQRDTLDEEGLRENIRYQIQNGVEGIVALGTTGESPTLTYDEKKRVVEIAKSECDGRVPLMIGTGSYSTRQTIENTLWAKEMGADSVLIICPYYNKPMQEGLFQHFKLIAEAAPDMPIMVYNHLGRTGQNMTTSTLKRLADIPNIVGVKEASGNINQIMEVIEFISRRRADFSVMSGCDELTLPLMQVGGHGVISVVSNMAPKEMHDLVNACRMEDYDIARSLHYFMMPLFRGACLETNPIPIKTAMNLKNMPSGHCRLPLSVMQPENIEKLSEIIKPYALNPIHA